MELGIPIYTIGLDYEGLMSKDAIKILGDTSDKTGAKSYKISKSEEIADTILSIYSDFIYSNNPDAITGKFSGEPQDFTIDIPDPYMLYVNMNVLSTSVIDISVVDPDGKDVTNTGKVYIGAEEGRYLTIQIIQPAEGSWTVTMTGEKDLGYTIDFVYLYTLIVSPKVTDKNGASDYYAGNARIETRLATDMGEISDPGVYGNIVDVTLNATDSNGNKYEYSSHFENNCYITDISDLPEGDYAVSIYLQHKYFTRDVVNALEMTLKPPAIPVTANSTDPTTTTVVPATTPQSTTSPPLPQDNGWLVILIAILVIIIIATVVFALIKGKGPPPVPIKGEFEIDISNDTANIDSFRTGGYFFSRDIEAVELSEIMRHFNVRTEDGKTDSMCEDIMFFGTKNGIMLKIKNKELKIMSNCGRIDGHPSFKTVGDYIEIEFKDANHTKIRTILIDL